MMDTIYETLKKIHSYWACLVIASLLLITIITFIKVILRSETTVTLKRISFYSVMILHLQLVFGMIIYFISPMVQLGVDTMKISMLRFYALEHPLMMVIGVVLVTIANVKLKKSDNVKVIVPILFLLGLVMILSRIPYNVWLH